jgi:predicted Zn-dependent protease
MRDHPPQTGSFRRRTAFFATALLAVALAFLNVFDAFAFARQRAPALPEWSPPASRAGARTPFAPRPLAGDNIFKGEAERWLAEAIAGIDSTELFGDEDVRAYVSRVGRNLLAHSGAPKKTYEFFVTADGDANAWTAGGGRVYVHVGMLRAVESEDELAGVLAHEIGHDAFGHAPKTVTRQLFWMTGVRRVRSAEEVVGALEKLFDEYRKKSLAAVGENLLGFSRFDELEADRAAFYTVYRAGYNPRALGAMFRRMGREVKDELGEGEYARQQFLNLLFGSHPPTSQRTTALSWESNLVKMPPRESRHASPAFDAMKARVLK